MSFFQYLKDTRGELRHVAWPTRTQTVIYTVLVVALSLLVALYLGFFDYIFTTGLSGLLEFLPANIPALEVNQVDVATSTPTSTPAGL